MSGSERANCAVDEPCRSRCVQNSGGFIVWRAAYLRTSAPHKPPASHGRTTVSRTLFVSRGHLRIYCVLIMRVFAFGLHTTTLPPNNEKIDKMALTSRRLEAPGQGGNRAGVAKRAQTGNFRSDTARPSGAVPGGNNDAAEGRKGETTTYVSVRRKTAELENNTIVGASCAVGPFSASQTS